MVRFSLADRQISTLRADRMDLLRLLRALGADAQQRGLSDWTPPHYAVSLDDGDAVEPLFENGPDVEARIRIDDCVRPVQLTESCG
ncbi:hypothetical protein [Bradyrhizobium sp. 30]|uniref:hypothetical protein n=1 Tax=Bradyrhizobium sp. 30 TaxID=2782669 RepID=UPI001FFBB773|nr:hypothetical protein [Bradyrhizobium sp. 30]MCK1293042.1 hypothetical protein [Bradyrhizobium sp. 30]